MEEYNKYKKHFTKKTSIDPKEHVETFNIIEEALNRGIKVKCLHESFLELEWKGKKEVFFKTDCSSLSGMAKRIIGSKWDTKMFLKRAKINVPRGKKFSVKDRAGVVKYAKSLKKGFVLKPTEGQKGQYVSVNPSISTISTKLREMGKRYDSALVEEIVQGQEYRVFATIKGFVAVSQRSPPKVIGDGKSSLRELILANNVMRNPKPYKKWILRKWIWTDKILKSMIKKQGYHLGSVIAEGKQVWLRGNDNVSTGGECIEMTEKMHSSVKKEALRILKAIPGLTYAGIDLITPDITKNITGKYRVIEINNMPGITLHHFPFYGKEQDAAGAILDLVFDKK